MNTVSRSLAKPNYYLIVLYSLLTPVLAYYYRLDPDVHHDGIMFTQALGVSEGLLPNKEVFAYYGPGSALIHGLVLQIFGNYLLALRLFTAIVIILSAHIMFNLLVISASRSLSFLLVITWVFGLGSNFPWSSAITTLLVLVSIYLLVAPWPSWRGGFLSIALAGSLIALGTYVRIHLILISILVGIWYLIYERDSKAAKTWIFTSFITHFFVLFLIIVTKSISGFLADSITYPSSVRVLTSYPKSYIVGTLWYPAFFLFFVLTTIAVQKLISLRNFKSLGYFILSLSAAFVLTILLSFYRQPRTGNVSYLNPRIVLIDGSWMLLCGTGYAALILTTLIGLRIRSYEIRSSQSAVVIIPIVLGACTQLYPLYDRFHLWFLAPIFIVGAVLNLHILKNDTRRYEKAFCIVLSFLFVFQCLSIASFFSIERVKSKSGVLHGMLMSENKRDQIDESVDFISKYAIPRETYFDCANGFFAGSNGRYLANNSNFVNWGPKKLLSQNTSKILIVCKSKPAYIEKYLASGWVLLARQKWSNPERKLPPIYNFALSSHK